MTETDSTPSPRQTIIDAALEQLMLLRGNPSIADVAHKAGLPASEVSAIFRTTDEIFAAFLGDTFEGADRQVRGIDGFAEFALREKLHAFFEALLEQLEPQRVVIPKLSLSLGGAWLIGRPAIRQLRERVQRLIAAYFAEAIERKEIPDMDLHSAVIGSFADYASTVVAYWVRDQSRGHQQTTQFIDQTLAVVLPAALSTARMRDLGQFLRQRAQLSLRGAVRSAGVTNGTANGAAPKKRVDELGAFLKHRVQIILGDAEPAPEEAGAKEGRGRGLRFRFVR